jgi:surfeit locus 1 family protein
VSVWVRAFVAPRMLGLHALAIVLTAAAVLLGIWQYGAWAHHREDTASQLANAAARPLDDVLTSDAPYPGDAVGQPVTFSGVWLPRSTVYVADRDLHGRRGVWAVTPVAVCPAGSACAKAPAMLVVRGWVPKVADAPAPPTGPVQVTGWLQPGEGSGLGDLNPHDDVIPEMRIADALQHVDQDLYGGYVIARQVSPGSTDGVHPVTPDSLPAPSSFTAVRNLLYAFEWWIFGGFAVFLWWRWYRDEVTRVTGVPSSA